MFKFFTKSPLRKGKRGWTKNLSENRKFSILNKMVIKSKDGIDIKSLQ